MRRTFARLFLFAFVAVLGTALVGCDETPTSVEDFDIQGTMDTPTGVTVLPGQPATFEVEYQGLTGAPSANLSSSTLTVSQVGQEGDATNGGRTTWEVALSEGASLDQLVTQNDLLVTGTTPDGKEITDTLVVTATTISVKSNFQSDFAGVADYEDAQRDSSASGGTTFEIVNNNDPVGSAPPNTPAGSNGVRYALVQGSASGSVTFERRTNLPNSDFFSFLVRPDPDDQFDLTITFTEETGSGTVERTATLPVLPGDQWLQYGISFDKISPDFNPVAQRAGGNGPLVSITMSADADVEYAIDEILFGTEGNPKVEFMDFERTTTAYGPPFCPPSFSYSDDVADESDGFRSRRVTGGGCFGYNYGGGLGPPPLLFLNGAEPNDVVSFRAKATMGDSLNVFIETPGGEGGYDNSGTTVGLPVGEWGTVTVPLSDLGDDVGTLAQPGIRNVGFTATGDQPDILIDDIVIRPASN